MFETTIGGKPVKMQGSFVAVMAYADEFGSDFHQDYQSMVEKGYASTSFYLKAAWCMAKGADNTTPHFKQWLDQMDPAESSLSESTDFSGWVGDVNQAIYAEMFRKKAPEQKQ